MPELPEVEAARLAIEDHCVGKKIKKAIVADDPKVIDGVLPRNFEASLVGKTIISGHRKGKNMWLQLDSPPFPSFQFGMAGAIYIKGVAVTKYKRSAVNDADEWPSKYSKIFIELEDGLELSFTDKRRFARVRLLNDPASEPPISDLGPDAFLEPMALDEFMDLLMKKNIAIKTVLLDQSCISGIGNWVADEVLYQARIHPLQTASSLSRESCTTLQECIKEVIRCAVEVNADCRRFPFEWLFHLRWNRKPGKVNGKEIDFISAGGRTTAYVPELQKLSGKQVVKASAKPRNRTSKNSKDIDKEGANEEENTDYAKSDKGQKAKGARKRPPAKNKSKVGETEDGGGNAEADEEEGGGDAEAGKEEGDGDEDQKKKSRAGSRKRQTRAVKSSNKKAKVSQKSEKPRKKGK